MLLIEVGLMQKGKEKEGKFRGEEMDGYESSNTELNPTDE